MLKMYIVTENLGETFDKVITSEIRERLGKYLDLTKTFIIEEKYIDRYWREEFSIHYSKTFYKDVDKFTTRVHLIREKISKIDNITEDNYLGYFILRPIPIRSGRISRIIVKPLREIFMLKDNEKLYIPTCEFCIHIAGKEIKFQAFPFYQQDSVVNVCAHADILMVTEYMHRKFHLNKPSISDFISYTLPLCGRSIPSIGLTLEQISIILNQMGYPTIIKFPFVDVDFNEESFNHFIEYIDSYLESGLPTILAIEDHVILIVGHTLGPEGEKDYIVYDDSGAFISEIKGNKMFCNRISRRELKDKVKKVIRNHPHNVALINVEFERMYFPFDSVKRLVEYIITSFFDFMKYVTKKRILISDSNEFKIFCSKNGVDIFNDVPLPHYIWIAELYERKGIICDIIIDASAHKSDIDSWIAIWIGDKVIFNPGYKSKDEFKDCFKVKKFPFVYSNLNDF